MTNPTRAVVLAFLRWTAPALTGAAAATTVVAMEGADEKAVDVAGRDSRSTPADSRRAATQPPVVRRWPAHARRDRLAPLAEPRDEGAPPGDSSLTEDWDEQLLPRASPQEVYETLLEGRDQYAERWTSEPVDVDWAGRAQDSLTEDLRSAAVAASVGEDLLSVRGASCKTTMCVLELEWSQAQAALDHGETIAMARLEQPCAIFMLGPSPEAVADGGSFRQEVFLDCA